MPELVLLAWCNLTQEKSQQAFQAIAHLGRRLYRRMSTCGDEHETKHFLLCGYVTDASSLKLEVWLPMLWVWRGKHVVFVMAGVEGVGAKPEEAAASALPAEMQTVACTISSVCVCTN
jgi:hypothetical protein